MDYYFLHYHTKDFIFYVRVNVIWLLNLLFLVKTKIFLHWIFTNIEIINWRGFFCSFFSPSLSRRLPCEWQWEWLGKILIYSNDQNLNLQHQPFFKIFRHLFQLQCSGKDAFLTYWQALQIYLLLQECCLIYQGCSEQTAFSD